MYRSFIQPVLIVLLVAGATLAPVLALALLVGA